MTIRAYDPRDFESLFEIDQAAFVSDLAYSRAELRFYVRSRRCRTLVAEEEAGVVGFAIGCVELAGHGHVVTLDVRPAHQRRGIGLRLLRALEETLEGLGATAFFLETPVEEERGARGFYEKQGYVMVRRERGYYNGRRDAWRMVKRPVKAPA